MNPERWERIQSLFHDAADLPEQNRQTYLERECTDDPTLIDEVSAMLDADARDSSLLDRGLAHAAHSVLDDDSASAHPLPSEKFGAYEIVGRLGEGGMGVVYLAERADLNSQAAIKILRDASLSPARRERFKAEQRTLAQLNHPSIARLYDSGTLDNGTPWFVMELVNGTPVTTYADLHDCSVEQRLRLFREICEAVQYAHSHLVIHRDLKPSNILVTVDGHVKLLDFGISKQLDTLDVKLDTTRTAVRMLTPAYAAPEQIRGEHAGVRLDIYSLGVILYELLAGQLPFDFSHASSSEAERIILEREPERPSSVVKRFSRAPDASKVPVSVSANAWTDLDVLCLTAMHKDADRRYRTVDALIRDVDHFLGQEPLEARSDSTGYRTRKFVARNRRPLLVAAGVVAAAILLVVFYTLRLTTARNEALAEAARAERMQRFTLNLLQGSDEAVGPAESLRVVTLIDRGVQEAKSLDREPAVQAELYETLGSVYQKLGKFGNADSLLRASLNQRQSLFGNDHPDVAQSLVALGMLRNAQAEYDSAESFVRRGLKMERRNLPPTHPAIAKAMTSLGQVLEEKGDYDRAIAVLDSAVKMQPNGGSSELRFTISELANSNFYAGHYEVSDSLNRRVLAIDRKLYGDHHPHVADDLINLGAIQLEFGNNPEAERYYREALAIVRPWYGNDHPETASTLTALGRVLVSEKKLDEAVGVLREAVGIQERVYGPVHPRVASALNELGRAAQQRGNLDEAEADFRRMAQIYKIVYNDKHYLIGVALSNLAGVYKDRKQYAESERIFREVLKRYAVVLEPDHQMVGIARVRLGETLLAARRTSDAEVELRAGYSILTRQKTPSVTWLERARKGLVAAYDSLGRPAEAAKIRTELAVAK